MADITTLADLTPDPNNARRHNPRNVGMIERALGEVGAARSIVIDEDGTVLAGNATIEAAAAAGIERVQVVDADGETIVAVRRTGLTLAQKTALALYDNRAAELATGWDADVLAAIAEAGEVDLSALWRDEELAEVLAGVIDVPSPIADAEPQIDRAAELAATWGTALGQTWQIGRHTLTIGDGCAVDPRGRAVVFDPPWDAGVGAVQSAGGVLAFCDGARAADIVTMYGAPAWVFVWDCVSSWYTPSRPLRRGKLCFWYGDITVYNPDGAHYGDSGDARDVWNTRGAYHFTPDPRGKHLADVFVAPITVEHADGASHAKPLDWVRMLLGNCTTGDVLDPFVGTGTSIVACEQLGRRCDAFEIDPGMAAVALQRVADALSGIDIRIAGGA